MLLACLLQQIHPFQEAAYLSALYWYCITRSTKRHLGCNAGHDELDQDLYCDGDSHTANECGTVSQQGYSAPSLIATFSLS
jgi:hypothetical protein